MLTLTIPTHGASPDFPVTPCANCAVPAGLALTPSRLVRTQALVLPGFFAGSETSVEVMLPFCASCRPTARRLRPTAMQFVVVYVAVLFAVYTVLFGGCMALGRPLPESLGWGLVFPLAVALALEVGWYVTRRPRGAASSYYQPVQLVTAAANGWRLRFTSAAYADCVRRANPGTQ